MATLDSDRLRDIGIEITSRGLQGDGEHLLEAGGPALETHEKIARPGRCLSAGCVALVAAGILSCICAVVVAFVVGLNGGLNGADDAAPTNVHVRKVAFGSCTQKELGSSLTDPIWTKAIIPQAPDAWIWLGDLAYLDVPVLDCSLAENQARADCTCEPSFLHSPPEHCMAGDVDNAIKKLWPDDTPHRVQPNKVGSKVLRGDRQVRNIVESPGYGSFLEYMCPGSLVAGEFPPPGQDPGVCPRPILGTWDDHDFGWNNGNRRLPNKDRFKQLYLDAIGAPRDSIRRSSSRGIYDWVTLNRDVPDESIDVILLDERYDRAPLPCHVQRGYCQDLADASQSRQVLCADALGGNGTAGECCSRDDDIALDWCARPGSNASEHFASACDPASPEFGSVNWALDGAGELVESGFAEWLQSEEQSAFCEVLGQKQRSWLDAVLQHAAAPLLVVASGSVLLGSPDGAASTCSGDDWDCYRPAQLSLLHKIAAAQGCVIVVAGDYHAADIKWVDPANTSAPYAPVYKTDILGKPVYQVMASGMSTSTAVGLDTSCGDSCCGWVVDTAGLRPGGACAVYGDPNFGMLELDWEQRTASMKVFRGDGDGVARGAGSDGAPIQLTISLETCLPV